MNRLLYLVRHSTEPIFKIGIGNHMRFFDLEKDYDISWKKSIYYEGDDMDVKYLESILHKTFKDHRVRRIGTGGTEWFNTICYDDVVAHIELYINKFSFRLSETKKCENIINEMRAPKTIRKKSIVKINDTKPKQKIDDNLYLDNEMNKDDFDLLFDFMEYANMINIDLTENIIDVDRLMLIVENSFIFHNGFAKLFVYDLVIEWAPKKIITKSIRLKPSPACYKYERELREFYNSR